MKKFKLIPLIIMVCLLLTVAAPSAFALEDPSLVAKEVVLVDLRYYRQAVSELAAQEQFDDILVCYSCANFLTDTNLMLLR